MDPERSSRKSVVFALPLTRFAFIFRAVLACRLFGGVRKRHSEMAPYAVTKKGCFSVTEQIPALPCRHFSKSLRMFRKVGFYVGPVFSFAFPHRELHGRSHFKLRFNSMHRARLFSVIAPFLDKHLTYLG